MERCRMYYLFFFCGIIFSYENQVYEVVQQKLYFIKKGTIFKEITDFMKSVEEVEAD